MAEELNVAAITQSAAATALQQPNGELETAAQQERAGTPVEDEPSQTDNALDDDEDDSDDENVNVVIKSNAATAPPMVIAAQQVGAVSTNNTGSGGTVFKGGVGQLTGIGTRAVQQKTAGVELDSIPTVNGVLLTEMDLEALEDKPWRLPGADLSDYFNYGFNEDTWLQYCDRQRRMRADAATRGAAVNNKLIPITGEYKAPQMIQTISRSDNFSEEQKNFLGLAGNATSAVTVSEAPTSGNAITTLGTANNTISIGSFPKISSDPGGMLPPPFIPGMPPMPPFGLPPFPGMPGGPVGFPGMPPGFPNFPPAAAIPSKATVDLDIMEFKTEPLSSPPDGNSQDDDIQVTKEYRRKDRDREHSPRERESKKRHHRDRERSEERSGTKRRGRHNSEEENGTGGAAGINDEKSGSSRSYKRSAKKHKDHHRDRDRDRSRSRDRTPTNDE
ncbi:pre-mRNA 3'-end-processing factor FIP1-like isoform X2 [Symsagittifera roscoffensis]|uniref:pre-mRNA 3'-end-processing factor FIP1-like isoform X2 n=1 Tax=Symsagittifera roscoffensis TaxID=84072 RepID=UPI00307C8569